MAPEKTKDLRVTDRRSFQYPKIFLGEHKVVQKKSINYLGVQLDRRLSSGKYLQIATTKSVQCGSNLARLMPNIGGPREAKRRLVACVVHSKLLHAASVWASAFSNHAIQKKLFSAQRDATSAVLDLASVPPIDLLPKETQETFQLRMELTCVTSMSHERKKKREGVL